VNTIDGNRGRCDRAVRNGVGLLAKCSVQQLPTN